MLEVESLPKLMSAEKKHRPTVRSRRYVQEMLEVRIIPGFGEQVPECSTADLVLISEFTVSVCA